MTINADPEFALLNEIFEDVSFNFCVQTNTCDIERYIHMVKDNTRKGYSSLPFEQIPCLLQPMLYSG
jgi:hypothetical protein